MVELKDYQQAVLDRLSLYLTVLKQRKTLSLNIHQVAQERQVEYTWDDDELNYPKNTWSLLNKRSLLPLISTKEGELKAQHKDRFNGLGFSVPNICLKVPTGGGKTLLGAGGTERIQTEFFEKNTGFVLWVVPSESIYRQTLKAFSNRDHLYRQILDRTSAGAGKVKILQKTDSFHFQDIQNYLCVMFLMLQSAGGQTKETLRIFKDSGKFPSFFPEGDNYPANQKLLEQYKNLDKYPTKQSLNKEYAIKQSLGNVLKMVQPLIIIDEGHRAYTEKAKKALMEFNPRFMLELSATPNKKSFESNVLVSVSGAELKKEEMIKLPINLFNVITKDWKKVLAKGYETLQDLSKHAKKLQAQKNRYIRPIMLIRVERTGKDQRDKKFIHSEDVREYLIKNFRVPPEEIKVKSATKDELKEENLMSEFSKVRYIITKEALKEGWDCPFAYILTILSKTKAPIAVEQMIGRVLRQPDTRKTGLSPLDQSYVLCRDQDTAGTVEWVKKGLDREGMDGLAGDIKTIEGQKTQSVSIKRRKPFRGLKIFLPKVLHRSQKGFKPLSYETDLLDAIDWSKFKIKGDLMPDDRPEDVFHSSLDIKKGSKELTSSYKGSKALEKAPEKALSLSFMAGRMSDIIPNSWDAVSLIKKSLKDLKKTHNPEKILNKSFSILNHLRETVTEQISQETEKIFRKKLKNKDILFKLVSAGDPDLNWEMAETLQLNVTQHSKKFKGAYDRDLQLSLFEDIYTQEFKFNDLETQVAWYLDENQAIKWWHRIIERQDWHLQGWQKHKIYPDFLVCVKSSKAGRAEFSILETKGKHIMGNPDTKYKEKVFKLFTEYSKKSVDAGTIEIQDQKMQFDLIMQNKWQKSLNQLFQTRSV